VTATISRPYSACPSGRSLAAIQLPLKDSAGKRQAYQIPVANLPAAGIPVPGTYLLRYSQSGAALASGTFTITGPPIGQVQFGRAYSRTTGGGVKIEHPTSTFTAGGAVSWVAYFAQPPDSKTISVGFDQIHGCSATRLLRDDHVRLSTPQAVSYANRVTVSDLQTLGLPVPGSYIVTYTAGGRFLARGEVTLRR
jgi:hypothetical protein